MVQVQQLFKVRTACERGGGSTLIAVAYSLSNDQEVCHSRTLTTISHGHHLLFQRMAIIIGMFPSTRVVWHSFCILSIKLNLIIPLFCK